MDYAAFENGIGAILLVGAAMPIVTGLLVVVTNAVFAMFD